MKYLLIIFIIFPPYLMASTLEEIETLLKNDVNGDVSEKISESLIGIISKEDQEVIPSSIPSEKVNAVNLAGKYKISTCVPALIENISKVSQFYDSIVSFEVEYSCVGALIKIGDDSVPKITAAIGIENDEFRLKLLSYTLMKIMSKEGALKHLDNLIKDETLGTRIKSLNSAKAEIESWHDNKSDAK